MECYKILTFIDTFYHFMNYSYYYNNNFFGKDILVKSMDVISQVVFCSIHTVGSCIL